VNEKHRVTQYARLYGELSEWPSKEHLASILRAAKLSVTVGRYSIRLPDLPHFVFREYGGDLGDPVIDANAASPDALTWEARRVSEALARFDIRHRFELYDERDQMFLYLHHRWPADETA